MSTLDVEYRADGVVTCWIDNPARRNALDDRMLAKLAGTLEQASDHGMRAVFIRGRHQIFCSGRDLGELDAAGASDEAALASRIAPALRLAKAVRHCAVPTAAVVEGRAVGLGVALASWCDVTLATQAASFSIPEARAGITPSFTAVSLMQAVGRRHALDLCLTGRVVGAAEAVALGLVQQVCTESDAETAVQALAASFLKGSPLALRECKRLLARAAGASFDEALGFAQQAAIASMQADEAAEGMAAFRGKRPPAWAVAVPEGRA